MPLFLRPRTFLLLLVGLLLPGPSRGEKLTITSEPPGAIVEIMGIREGTALVKVPGRGFKTLPLAAADTVKQGDAVFAIGNPASGLPFSVTKGIVSGVGKFPNAAPPAPGCKQTRRSIPAIAAAFCSTPEAKSSL